MSVLFNTLRLQTYKNIQTFNKLFNHHPKDVVNFRRTNNNQGFSKLISNSGGYIGLQSTKSFVSDLKKLLTYGIDKVNDMNRTIDFQNNELVDRDVEYGFSKKPLGSWFDSFMKGESSIDTFF